MKDLKLLQTIGKGEFGGEREGVAALGGPRACGESGEQPPALFPRCDAG